MDLLIFIAETYDPKARDNLLAMDKFENEQTRPTFVLKIMKF